MIDKFCAFCKTAHHYVYDSCYSVYELLIKVIEKIDDLIDFVNDFQEQIDRKEDSDNITSSRKLSENGDFTGTWFMKTYQYFIDRIENGQRLYEEVIDLINSNPQLNITIYDGKFFLTNEVIEKTIDGGLFTDINTNEIDAGLFIYPCLCSN